jgi:hypothetical protein
VDAASLEAIALATYRRAKRDPGRPMSTFALARAVDVEVLRLRDMAGAPAGRGTSNGKRFIAVKQRLPEAYARFFAAHELAHFLLDEEGYDAEDLETCCDYLGAALMAPRPAVIGLKSAFGLDPRAIAKEVGGTETMAALRVGEVLRIPLAVVAPIVRVRGPEEWVWPSVPELRRLARLAPRKLPRGLAKTKLTDDPRRVLLVADDLTGTD